MMPEGIKERFELYRKWFNTFLVREFLNLPQKYQEQFLSLLKKFTENCTKVYEENKVIKEKVINIIVTEIISPDNKQENYIICGKSSDLKKEIKMSVPINKTRPKIGSKLYHTVFSIDGVVWYSSKEELITKG
jgi:hypothetical protein